MNVLACLDRSAFGESVCDHAGWAADRTGGTVTLLHVTETQRGDVGKADFSGILGVDTTDDLLEELARLDEQRNRVVNQAGRELLNAARARLHGHYPSVVSDRHLAHGDVFAVMKPLLRTHGLVTMGRQGEGHQDNGDFLGRNLERVIRTGHHATLVVPQTFAPIRRALFAFDASPSVGAAAALLVENALLRDVEIHMLLVGEADQIAAAHLAAAGDHLASAGYAVTREIAPGNPREVLLDAVGDGTFDLLIMGAYGHSRIRSLVVGSTTTALVSHCPSAVLVVH